MNSFNTNFFNIIHLSENDHTNILAEVLNIEIKGEKALCKSFLGMLDIDIKSCSDFMVSTQNSAISLKGDQNYGFIDLLITFRHNTGKTVAVCIENKVCEAVDGKWQLQRYYCSLSNCPDGFFQDFREQFETFKPVETFDIVHIVYLTSDGKKQPGTERMGTNKQYSISKELKEYLGEKYHEISYKDNVLPWLKNEIAMICDIDESSSLQKSLELYVKSLTRQIEFLTPEVAYQLTPENWQIYAIDGYLKIFRPAWKKHFGGRCFSTVHLSIFGWTSNTPSLSVCIENKSYKAQKALQDELENKYGKGKHSSNKYFSITIGLKDWRFIPEDKSCLKRLVTHPYIMEAVSLIDKYCDI